MHQDLQHIQNTLTKVIKNVYHRKSVSAVVIEEVGIPVSMTMHIWIVSVNRHSLREKFDFKLKLRLLGRVRNAEEHLIMVEFVCTCHHNHNTVY